MRKIITSNLLTRIQTSLSALTLVILTASMLSLAGCNKEFNDKNYPDPEPKIEMVTQLFGLNIESKATTMTAKSWDKTTWVTNFSPTAYELKLTGVGNPNVYKKTVTVAELKSGTINFDMLPGNYDVTYRTIHIPNANPFSMNGLTSVVLNNNAIGDVCDIKIQNNVTVTGTPLQLVATLDDALIVVDIPDVSQVKRYLTLADQTAEITAPRLLQTVPTINYGYVSKATFLTINFNTVAGKNVDLSNILLGNSYHVVTPFGATVELLIPDWTPNDIII